MGEACGLYGGVDKCMQGFGGETWRKETTWKTEILMADNIMVNLKVINERLWNRFIWFRWAFVKTIMNFWDP